MDIRDYAIEFGNALNRVRDARAAGDRTEVFNAERQLGKLVVDHLLELSDQPAAPNCGDDVCIERYLTSGCEDTLSYVEWRRDMNERAEGGHCE